MADEFNDEVEMIDTQTMSREMSKPMIALRPASNEQRHKLVDDLEDMLEQVIGEDDGPKQVEAEAPPKPSKKETKRERPTAPDGFPTFTDADLTVIASPAERLSLLMEELAEHRDYAAVRNEYCALSIELNRQRRLAPAFRPLPRFAMAKDDPIHMDIYRDQLVIDCHWLYSRNEMIDARDSEYMPMFNQAEPFRFDLAWKFASLKWTRVQRAEEALTLSPRQRCQLATLRDDYADAVLHGKGKAGSWAGKRFAFIRCKIRQWCERDKRIVQYRRDYEHLWLAETLLKDVSPPPTIGQIAELHGLISGAEKRDNKTVRDKIKKLQARIGGD